MRVEMEISDAHSTQLARGAIRRALPRRDFAR